MYRTILTNTERILTKEKPPIILIIGLRQVGKSTLAQSLCKKKPTVRFNFDLLSDIAEFTNQDRNTLELFAKKYSGHTIIIDEVQKSQEAIGVIKHLYDTYHLRFILTGSSEIKIRQGIGDSLAGRVEEIKLYPLSLSEINIQKGLDFDAMLQQVNPPEGFDLSVRYADLGPRLIDAGVIDYGKFAAVLENAGEPLTSSQIEILQGRDAKMVITPENAHFLLNFFWAVGLANKNKILTEGPMVQRSEGKIENFASTGGWTLGAKPVTELYASLDLISLDPEQQARVEEVASAVYRPCCNNPTLFPDCNHGMAMLGLLELMASQGASVDKMFETAKSMNAYWFPQQAMETAIFLKSTQNIDFGDADGRLLVGKEFFSSSGFSKIHQILQTNGLLQTLPGGSNGCST